MRANGAGVSGELAEGAKIGWGESGWAVLWINRLVRFSPVNLFIGLAERTHLTFHLLDKPESHAPLFVTSVLAYGAFDAALGHGTVAVCNFRLAHSSLPHPEVGVLSQAIRPLNALKPQSIGDLCR